MTKIYVPHLDIEHSLELLRQSPSAFKWAVSQGNIEDEFMRNLAAVPENEDAPKVKGGAGGFVIYVPVTGGMDSTTLWQMAKENGQPYRLFYCDCGQEYADLEYSVACELTGEHVERLNAGVQALRYDHILLGRNAAIIVTLAEEMRQRAQWGEIWFGVLAGESPIVGGDKSRRFLQDINRLLLLAGYDCRVVTPLIGMDKTDEVQYWMARDLQLFQRTKCCFSAEERECGRCQSCFRKWVAFFDHRIDISGQFASGDFRENFRPFAAKYKPLMTDAYDRRDFSRYSRSRILSTLAAIRYLETWI